MLTLLVFASNGITVDDMGRTRFMNCHLAEALIDRVIPWQEFFSSDTMLARCQAVLMDDAAWLLVCVLTAWTWRGHTVSFTPEHWSLSQTGEQDSTQT